MDNSQKSNTSLSESKVTSSKKPLWIVVGGMAILLLLLVLGVSFYNKEEQAEKPQDNSPNQDNSLDNDPATPPRPIQQEKPPTDPNSDLTPSQQDNSGNTNPENAQEPIQLETPQQAVLQKEPTWPAVTVKPKGAWTIKAYILGGIGVAGIIILAVAKQKYLLAAFVGVACLVGLVGCLVSHLYCPYWLYEDPYTLAKKKSIAHRLVTFKKKSDTFKAAWATYTDMRKYDPFTIDLYRVHALQEQAATAPTDEGKSYYRESLDLCNQLLSIVLNNGEKALVYRYKGIAHQALDKEEAAKEAFEKATTYNFLQA